jgi:hypothetical protein
MSDAGMPMPALGFWMPMPTYVINQKVENYLATLYSATA